MFVKCAGISLEGVMPSFKIDSLCSQKLMPPTLNMLRVTDTEKTTEVVIPCQLAESSGILKDMMETCNGMEGTEPVSKRRLLS
jgi:hypothetical protein